MKSTEGRRALIGTHKASSKSERTMRAHDGASSRSRPSNFQSNRSNVATYPQRCRRVIRLRAVIVSRSLNDVKNSVAAMCVCNPDRSPVGINR